MAPLGLQHRIEPKARSQSPRVPLRLVRERSPFVHGRSNSEDLVSKGRGTEASESR